MKKLNMDKRGELTTTQLVMLIVLIVSFIIILFLIFRLNPAEQSNKEICQNSVVLKSKSAGIAGSLDCRTNYLCVSGGDSCVGIPTTSEAEINVDSPDATKEIMNALAEEMSDCWYMFGEGELGYEDGFREHTVHCAVCSIVDFDEKIREKNKKISYQEFYEYLRKTEKTDSQSYLSYLYDVNDASLIKDGNYFNFDLSKQIDTSVRYSIITGVDMNVLGKDRYLSTFIVPTSETSSTKCDEFITKA